MQFIRSVLSGDWTNDIHEAHTFPDVISAEFYRKTMYPLGQGNNWSVMSLDAAVIVGVMVS